MCFISNYSTLLSLACILDIAISQWLSYRLCLFASLCSYEDALQNEFDNVMPWSENFSKCPITNFFISFRLFFVLLCFTLIRLSFLPLTKLRYCVTLSLMTFVELFIYNQIKNATLKIFLIIIRKRAWGKRVLLNIYIIGLIPSYRTFSSIIL